MRISYFGYVMRHVPSGTEYLVDMRPFLRGFAAWKGTKFKNEITYNGEQVFLLKNVGDLYLFVQARDHEIIKAIQKDKLSVSDVQRALQKDESVGFASYVLIEKHWLAIGSRLLSPRIRAFADFMLQITHRCGLEYEFVPKVFTEHLPSNKVQTLDEVSAVTVEMNASNPMLRDLYNVLSGGGRGFDDVASLQITMKRYRRGKKTLLPALRATLGALPSKGLESVDVRARRQAADHMTDIYIVGEGGIKDDIDVADERKIPEAMLNKSKANSALIEKSTEFIKDARYKAVTAPVAALLDWQPPRARLGGPP
jgi:hypothetical protein